MDKVQYSNAYKAKFETINRNLKEHSNDLRSAIHFLLNGMEKLNDNNDFEMIGLKKKGYLQELRNFSFIPPTNHLNENEFFSDSCIRLQEKYFGRDFRSLYSIDNTQCFFSRSESGEPLIIPSELLVYIFDKIANETLGYLHLEILEELDENYLNPMSYDGLPFSFYIERKKFLQSISQDIEQIQNLMFQNKTLIFIPSEKYNDEKATSYARLSNLLDEENLYDFLTIFSFAYIYVNWIMQVHLEMADFIKFFDDMNYENAHVQVSDIMRSAAYVY